MITILFAGMIAHVLTSGGEQRAVFIAAPQHVVRLYVRAEDIVEVYGFREVASLAGERTFDLAGERLSLESGAHGPTIRTDALRTHVVGLSAITDATALRDEVERGELFDGASAYLDLHGGVLDVDEQSVTREISYHLDSRDVVVCAAWGVRYTAPVAGDAVTLRGAGGAILRLRPGAVARIENLPPADYRDPHFHAAMMILKNVSTIASPAFTGRQCGGHDEAAPPRIGRIRATAVPVPLTVGAPDCTITQWP